MDLTIRRAVPDELDALARLAAETFPLACPPGTTDDDVADFVARHLTAARFAGYLADPARVVLVAEQVDEDGTALVGYAMLIGGEPADAEAAAVVAWRPAIELSKFYTRRTAHGSGVAPALMRATLEAARAQGAAACWLGVNEHNARAIRFYEKHGFARAGRKHFALGGRIEHDWVLAQPLGA